MKGKIKIVFWGEDSFSNVVLSSLINAGHEILAVITPYYENLKYKRLELSCLKNKIPFNRFKKIDSDEVYEFVVRLKPDLCVITHFEKLIPAKLLSIPRLGFINLHPSLLPLYRGMSPQHWPIINGDKETGLSVHYVDKGVDTGHIIVQERISLTQDMYVSDLQKIWLDRYPYVMMEAIERILRDEKVIEQKGLVGSYYGRLREEQCRISKDMSIQETYNLVRGVSLPYQGASYEDIVIYRGHVNMDTEIDYKFRERGDGLFEDANLGMLLKLNGGILIIDKFKKL